MTISELIQARMERRTELLSELRDVEAELVDAGALLAVTVTNAPILRRRGRSVKGDSIRAEIFRLLADHEEHAARDITRKLPVRHESVMSQLSRMAIEGDIVRVRNGWYRLRPAEQNSDTASEVA